MKSGIEKHPAHIWGQLVRERRLEKMITAREMSEFLEISPSKYSEIEQGILKWITPEIEQNLCDRLFYSEEAQDEFYKKLDKGRKFKKQLNCLGDIFEQVEILPLFPPMKTNGKRMTAKEMQEMVDYILLPLEEKE